jgi:GIY-YIG catalytic domain
LHPADFYRLPQYPEPIDGTNTGCIYFIIDRTLPILLYIGETKLTAHQRWLGTHYCKDYVMGYIEMHRRYKLDVAVCSAFWQHVPPDKKVLRQWERELILKWCPVFNKEMWQKFGQPFGRLSAG